MIRRKGAPALIRLVPLSAVPPAQVEALLDVAFGQGRFGRTAYKLRAGVSVIDTLSLAALGADGVLIGSLQSWPVALETADGQRAPLVLVGPVAVSPDVQRGGIGRTMMTRMLETADAGAADALMMIGDPEYYGRFFGFTADATTGWDLPGPVERHRLLARIRRPGGVPATGRIVPDGRVLA
jgi:predicted N-acetyltransferase YhbS